MMSMMKTRPFGFFYVRLSPFGAHHRLSHSAGQEVTRRLTFYESNPISPDAPVVIVYAFLGATTKSESLIKTVDYYSSKGFDVLTVRTAPTEFMWPSRAQRIVDDVLRFSAADRLSKRSILIHTFSVGNYMYGETLFRSTLPQHRADNGRDNVESSFKGRIIGQVIDSLVDIAGVPNAIGLSLTKHCQLQRIIKDAFNVYLYSSYRFTLRHYLTAAKAFHEAPPLVPSLWLFSRIDSFMSAEDVEKSIAVWEALGIACRKKCWADSGHVKHLKMHGDEYTKLLDDYLETVVKGTTTATTVTTTAISRKDLLQNVSMSNKSVKGKNQG